MIIHRFKNADGVQYDIRLVESLESESSKTKRGKAKPDVYEGDCGEPKSKEAFIRLNESLFKSNRNRRQLSVIIEEMLHAHDWELTEKVVRKYSANTAKILYKLGWRPPEHTDYESQIRNTKHGRRTKHTNARGSSKQGTKKKNS